MKDEEGIKRLTTQKALTSPVNISLVMDSNILADLTAPVNERSNSVLSAAK